MRSPKPSRLEWIKPALRRLVPTAGERLLSNLAVILNGSASSTSTSNKLVPGSIPVDNSAETFSIKGSIRNICKASSKDSTLTGVPALFRIRERM